MHETEEDRSPINEVSSFHAYRYLGRYQATEHATFTAHGATPLFVTSKLREALTGTVFVFDESKVEFFKITKIEASSASLPKDK